MLLDVRALFQSKISMAKRTCKQIIIIRLFLSSSNFKIQILQFHNFGTYIKHIVQGGNLLDKRGKILRNSV